MTYGTNIEKNGQIIHRSKNLRGMRDYARVSPVARIECTPVEGGGRLRIIYKDGASTSARFASYHIMVDWVRNRRSWRSAATFFYGGDVGYLTNPGILAGGIQA